MTRRSPLKYRHAAKVGPYRSFIAGYRPSSPMPKRSLGNQRSLAATMPITAVDICIGIGFQRGTHTRWQLVANDATGTPTLTDMG